MITAPTNRPDLRSRLVSTGVLALCAVLLTAATSQGDGSMQGLTEAISNLLQQPLLLVFAILFVGLGLGMIRLAGLSLGSSGVLFAALAFGNWGQPAGWELPEGIGSLGLVLFVYSIGLSAGSTFFRTFVSQGRQLALLAAVVVLTGAITTIAVAQLFRLPSELAVGLFAGSMTSTPALAAAAEGVGRTSGDAAAVSIGYGLAYPIGVVATVLFAQALPRLLRVDLDAVGHKLAEDEPSGPKISRQLVEVCNPAVIGKPLTAIKPLQNSHGQITRVLEQGRLIPVKSDHVLQAGQVLMLVADEAEAEMLTLILGRKSEAEAAMDADRDRSMSVVTNPAVLSRTLRELDLRGKYGVTISRVERYGASFVPTAETTLMMGDRLTIVGPPDGLKAFLQASGHRVRKLHETDLMSLAAGLTVGIAIGQIPFQIPGAGTIKLGLAGGPLLAGLLFAHFGRFLGVVGYMPIAARMLAQELGLVLFLASAGFAAGGSFLEMVGQYGAAPFVASGLIATVPILSGFAFSKWALRIDLLRTLGGTCGAMTSTAALGALTSKTDSELPIASYAAAYPMALVLMTLCAQMILLSSF